MAHTDRELVLSTFQRYRALGYQIMNEQPDPLTAIRAGVPMELERIVGKMLAKNPAERYQHAEEVPVDLLNPATE